MALLEQPGMGDWIRYKLDRHFDHILIDEAQDTNMRQWGIVLSLAEEFFAGTGASEDRLRTLFTVGGGNARIGGQHGVDRRIALAQNGHKFGQKLRRAVGRCWDEGHARGNLI